MKFTNSIELYRESCNYLPLGVSSPIRTFSSVDTPPLYITKAIGCELQDVDGNHYIDFINGLGPALFGHSPKFIREAIVDNFDGGMVHSLNQESEIKAARIICENNDFIDKVRFVCSGSEAVMSALRLARAFTNKNALLKFNGCYHGHSDMALGGRFNKKVTSKGIPDSLDSSTFITTYNDIESLRECFAENGSDLAAAIIEPIATNMGLILPDMEFLATLRELCTKHKVILIFDEVVVGFRYRIGSIAPIFGISPDLVIFGKILGGGTPIGAYAGKDEIMSLLENRSFVFPGGTFAANPFTLRAVLAVLEKVSEEGFYQDLDAKGDFLCKKLNKGFNSTSLSYSSSNYGSLVSLNLSGKPGLLKNHFDVNLQNEDLFAKLHLKLAEKGFLIPPSIEEPIFISEGHSKEHLVSLSEAIINSICELSGERKL